MLKCTPDNLRIEIEAAIKLRRRHTEITDGLIRRYAGGSYRSDWTPDEASIENHEFEFIVNTVPAVMANNPAVSIRSRRPVVQRELVQAMQHGVNRWIRDVDLRGVLEPVLYDTVFGFGVTVITMEPVPGFETREVAPLRPALRRISPNRFFMDPQADGPANARFTGHLFVRDREDLLNAKDADGRPKYDKAAVAALTLPDDDTGIGGDLGLSADMRIDRDQVVAAEIFVPEKKMIYTIGFAASGDGRKEGRMLRAPRRYFGHPRGPYILFGFYVMPDQVYPLSPLMVTAESVMELNAHASQVRRQAATARNIVLVDATNAAMLDAVKNYEDGSVAAIPNFDARAFAEVSLGGPNPGQLDYIQRLRDRLDRRSGLTDIMRGQVSGKATATEVQAAESASNGRVRYMQDRVRQSVMKCIENAAYIMFESNTVVFPVTMEKAEELAFEKQEGGSGGGYTMKQTDEEDMDFMGGPQEGQEDYSFFDLEITIEPYTMEQVSEAVLQRRMETAVQTVASFGPQMLQYPFINWPDLLDDYFQALNIPDGRKYVNFEMLAQMIQQQYAAGQVQGIPGLDGAPPPDFDTFRGPPSVPAGASAAAAVRETEAAEGTGGAGGAGGGGAGGQAAMMSGLLAGAM